MRILAADDETLALNMLTDAIRTACDECEIFDFRKPSELLEFAKNNDPCDIAFLDIRMRGMTGIELAKKLKDIMPHINLIFVTGYNEYVGSAMEMHASGYIYKPVTPEKVRREISDLRYPLQESKVAGQALLKAKCFGNFDVFLPDGNPVRFNRQKSKEVFAYLVNKSGSSCSIKEIAAALFEDVPYDKKQQGYMQKIISSMMHTLKEVGTEAVVVKDYNSLAVNTNLLDCDYYRFTQLDPGAVNAYKGEYMSQYPWAEFVIGYLENMYRK